MKARQREHLLRFNEIAWHYYEASRGREGFEPGHWEMQDAMEEPFREMTDREVEDLLRAVGHLARHPLIADKGKRLRALGKRVYRERVACKDDQALFAWAAEVVVEK